MDIVGDLAHLAARSRADADLCRTAAAQVAALGDVRWRSFAAARFREEAAGRAQQLRVLAGQFEVLAFWLEQLLGIVRRTEGGP